MKYSVSLIVPVRDEEGTISELVTRVPLLGKHTEIIFVEGFSKDGSWEVIKKISSEVGHIKSNNQKLHIRAYKQRGKMGKGRAVEIGFDNAKGDILIILDADLSVPPESLRGFYQLLASRRADFVNGSRFIYPKEKGAMRYFNHLGNRFFAFIFSIILGQRITDTLCGTKALFRKDWLPILEVTRRIRKDDPYGDFTLLLGAAKLGLRVAEVPIKYKARVYGKSKISPFWDGIKLFVLLAKDIRDYFISIFS